MGRVSQVGLLAALLAGAAGSAPAQIRPGDLGMRLVSRSGTAGTLCRGFQCSPFQASVTANENVRLELRGPRNAPFWVFVSPKAPLCASIPGLKNSLILGPPYFLAAAGTLATRDTIRACPGGRQVLAFPIVLGSGARFALQAILLAQWRNGRLPTFTPAIDVRVR